MLDHDEFCHARPTVDPRRCAECKQLAAARADERQRQRANLHAKLEALPTFTDADLIGHLVWRSDVLALFDGGSDGDA